MLHCLLGDVNTVLHEVLTLPHQRTMKNHIFLPRSHLRLREVSVCTGRLRNTRVLTRTVSACLARLSTPTRNSRVRPPASPRSNPDLRQTEALISHLISANTPLTEVTPTSTYTWAGFLCQAFVYCPSSLPPRTLSTRRPTKRISTLA